MIEDNKIWPKGAPEIEQKAELTTVTRDDGVVAPNVAKVGGLQSQGVKGEIVVGYLDPLTTQDLKSSGFPSLLGRG